MLNFTIKKGEYFTIGEDIHVVFTGGTKNNAKIMIDAPKSLNIVRGTVLERTAVKAGNKDTQKKYYPEPEITSEDIRRLIKKQKQEKGIKTAAL